jgi:hypothetical protein
VPDLGTKTIKIYPVKNVHPAAHPHGPAKVIAKPAKPHK